MCNCDCENYERCSIVGYFPVAFCCSKCVHREAREVCFGFVKEENFGKEEIPVHIAIIN